MKNELKVCRKVEVACTESYCNVVIDGVTVDEFCEEVVVCPDGNFKVLKNGVWTYRTNDNKVMVSGSDAVVFPAKDGMIRVFNGEKYTYFFEDSRIKWPFIFDEAEDFENGIAKVVFKGAERTISKEGKFID